MDEPIRVSIASLVMMVGTYAASFTALFYLFQRHIGGTPLVTYEARHRVPWGPGLAMVAILIPFTTVMAAIWDTTPRPADATVVEEVTEQVLGEDASETTKEPDTFIRDSLFACSVMLVFVLAVGFVVHDFLGADAHDFGLPATGEQLVADVALGILACVASILPIHMTMYVLTQLLQPETEHPLINELQQSHTPAVMVVSVLMVVIAAPLFEEFSFRLLLQGWLEKWEDEQIGYSGTLREPESGAAPHDVNQEFDDQVAEEDAVLLPIPQKPVALPRSGVLRDLPHGWLPILISATLFGLAHWGHGVSPVPLVLFGIVLGYLYQRTHRIVPSITAHAVFNAYTMVLLWLSF